MLADLDATEKLDARSRRFLLELVYGILRRRMTLDCILAAYSNEPLARLDTDCLQVLRLGLYQLVFLDGVPPFAAVSESVDLVHRRHEGVRSFVNGVLRSIEREMQRVEIGLDRGGASPRKRLALGNEHVAFFSKPVFTDPKESRALYLAQIHSVPVFLVERWLARHDAAVVEAILEGSNRKPPVTARIQRLRTNRDSLLRRLVAEGLVARPGILDEAIQLDAAPMDIVRSAAFKEGLFYMQDEAAMKVAHAVAPKPGERILDLCAAPGGKATHLAELASDEIEVVAVDRDARRLERVTENMQRLGLKGVKPVVWDPLGDAPVPEEARGIFDAVLLDVPCSNTGVLARRPEVRWRVSVDAIRELADQGRRLLHAAVKSVRPGGRLVFSTCSLEGEENEDAVKRALVANPRLELVHREETLPSPNGPDGGFFAVFHVGGEGR